MSKNARLANAVVAAQADLLARALDNGYLRIYSGMQPAGADTAVTDQVLLVELRLGNPSAPASINGVLALETVDSVTTSGTGTATWFRCLSADGSSPVLDGSVGLAAATPNLALATTDVMSGGLFVLDTYTHTVAKATPGL